MGLLDKSRGNQALAHSDGFVTTCSARPPHEPVREDGDDYGRNQWLGNSIEGKRGKFLHPRTIFGKALIWQQPCDGKAEWEGSGQLRVDLPILWGNSSFEF